MPKRTLLITSLLPLFACVGGPIPEQNFPEVWADSWCDRYLECAEADFEASYHDAGSCRADQGDDRNFESEWKDLLCGDYDANAARDCINTLDSMQCDDWANDEWQNECARVYGC